MRSAALLLVVSVALGTMALPEPVRAEDGLQDRFQEANGHYYKKRYGQAKGIYQELIDTFHIRNAVVFYNLANTHHQLRELGRAVVNYKRALAMQPDDALAQRIRDNLEKTTEALIDRHRKEEIVQVLDETHGVAFAVAHLIPDRLIASFFLAFWALFFGALIARRLLGERHRRLLKVVAIVVSVPLVLSGILLGTNIITGETTDRAVIVEDNVLLRDGKHRDASATEVPEGLEVRILDDSDPCQARIQLSNGKQGWVPARAIERITGSEGRPLVVKDPNAACGPG